MKKRDLLSRLVTGCASYVGAGSTFCPGCQTRDKRAPLLSRTGVPGWETGTTAVSQPGQINVFVVVKLNDLMNMPPVEYSAIELYSNTIMYSFGTNDLFACDLFASTNDSFMCATK